MLLKFICAYIPRIFFIIILYGLDKRKWYLLKSEVENIPLLARIILRFSGILGSIPTQYFRVQGHESEVCLCYKATGISALGPPIGEVSHSIVADEISP